MLAWNALDLLFLNFFMCAPPPLSKNQTKTHLVGSGSKRSLFSWFLNINFNIVVSFKRENYKFWQETIALRRRSETSFCWFVPNAPFLYPLNTSENRKVFWCFQGVEKECSGNKWVNRALFAMKVSMLTTYVLNFLQWKIICINPSRPNAGRRETT